MYRSTNHGHSILTGKGNVNLKLSLRRWFHDGKHVYPRATKEVIIKKNNIWQELKTYLFRGKMSSTVFFKIRQQIKAIFNSKFVKIYYEMIFILVPVIYSPNCFVWKLKMLIFITDIYKLLDLTRKLWWHISKISYLLSPHMNQILILQTYK